MEKKSEVGQNNSGVASVIFGILGMIFVLIPFFGALLGFVLGLIGLIFGIVQAKKFKNKWSTAGIILSIISLLLNIIAFIWFVSVIVQVLEYVQQLEASGALPF